MTFRFRLALFFVATLVAVQLLTAVLSYNVTREGLIREGERQLAAAGDVFQRQLNDVSERAAETVKILSLDYALRGAIARHDKSTVLSALPNSGQRIGASRMMWLGLDGKILADTADSAAEGQAFPYSDLLDVSFQRPSTALVATNGQASLMVVVPVLAPTTIAFIAAAIPVNDDLLAKLQKLSSLPDIIELVTVAQPDRWTVVASSDSHYHLSERMLAGGAHLSDGPRLATLSGADYVALAVPMEHSQQSPAVAVVLGYSLDKALHPFLRVVVTWVALLVAGLVAGLVGAMLIARSVSRPVELLARAARRIEAGDYTSQPVLHRRDEIGQLAGAFANMARAIGDREERIRFQAEHDSVTGLVNRSAIERAIDADLCPPGEPATATLVMIGMTRLAEISKTVGHVIADRVMSDAARRIERRFGNTRMIARVNDTSFVIWLSGVEPSVALDIADEALELLRLPYQEGALAIDMTPIAGVCHFPTHGRAAIVLLQRAEVAMFSAAGSENAVIAYDPDADPHRAERLSLMGDLRAGLERDELQLHYQPKLNLTTGLIDASEALVRWTHPRHGFVPPDSFIGLAEETGNIGQLTRWALGVSATQACRWQQEGWAVRIGVNLSVHDLADPSLPQRVADLLESNALPPESMLFEITESAVMGEPERAIRVLRQLADMGIDLSIDDFGVGQSSFAYLRRLPVREIKIDKSFVLKLAEDDDDRTIVQSIVELGHRLRYRVTAEGVENAVTLAFLKEIGCDHAQGYHITKALPPDAFASFVAGGNWRVKSRAMVS